MVGPFGGRRSCRRGKERKLFKTEKGKATMVSKPSDASNAAGPGKKKALYREEKGEKGSG